MAAVAVRCSICFDDVVEGGARGIATLQCSHQFHLDCIGSAFNSVGSMQCPNCRATENGDWHRFRNSTLGLEQYLEPEQFVDLPTLDDMDIDEDFCPLHVWVRRMLGSPQANQNNPAHVLQNGHPNLGQHALVASTANHHGSTYANLARALHEHEVMSNQAAAHQQALFQPRHDFVHNNYQLMGPPPNSPSPAVASMYSQRRVHNNQPGRHLTGPSTLQPAHTRDTENMNMMNMFTLGLAAANLPEPGYIMPHHGNVVRDFFVIADNVDPMRNDFRAADNAGVTRNFFDAADDVGPVRELFPAMDNRGLGRDYFGISENMGLDWGRFQ